MALESNLNLLETKVMQAVNLIQELRSENKDLQSRCDELAAQLEEIQAARQRLSSELDLRRQRAVQAEDFEVKRKEIEDKVGGLLQKMEALG